MKQDRHSLGSMLWYVDLDGIIQYNHQCVMMNCVKCSEENSRVFYEYVVRRLSLHGEFGKKIFPENNVKTDFERNQNKRSN